MFPREFIEWKDFSYKTFIDRYNKKYVALIGNPELSKKVTLDELYIYWLTEIKDKQ